MATIIGSSRHDENFKYQKGQKGDQLQHKIDDFNGEVSMQYIKDFIGKRKFYVVRFKKAVHAIQCGNAMKTACNNINLGYSQSDRNGVMLYGVDSTRPTNCDCSSLTRACIKEATGIDIGNFTTANALSFFKNSKLFDNPIVYTVNTKIYEGDIIITQTKGHVGICVEGLSRIGVTPKPSYIHNGVDFAKVFDADFYAEKNPDVKKALGTNPNVLFSHFIQFGCNEQSRWGKTIPTFNVEVYASHSPDLLKAFGRLNSNGSNGYPYYRHFCTNGYKENRRYI